MKWITTSYLSAFGSILLIVSRNVSGNQLTSVKSSRHHHDDLLNGEDESMPTESTGEIFVATQKWQEVRPGQTIPRGLHVRVNMQTGKKEAKLLDVPGQKVDEKGTPPILLDPVEIKAALKNIKNDMKTDAQTTAGKFRTIDELESEIKDINAKIESEFEIMARLVDDFLAAPPTDPARIASLDSLEFYLHQHDNAVDFVEALQGVSRVIVPSLNSSVEIHKAAACFIVGSAAQSNPRVQIAFFEAGLVNTLLRLVNSPSSPSVCGKAVYGISAVLRNFPEAQNSFIRQGGLAVLRNVFKFTGQPFDKIKIKVLTLMQDLLEERVYQDSSSTDEVKRIQQYQQNDLAALLQASGWCQVFQSLLMLPSDDKKSRRDDILAAVSDKFPLRVEHDNVEKIVSAMLSLRKECAKDFIEDQALSVKLHNLYRHYEELKSREENEEGSDNFFTELLEKISVVYTLPSQTNKSEL